MGHLIPISIQKNGHNAENVVWIHRRCNETQSEQGIDKIIKHFMDIIKAHGYNIEAK